MITIAEQAMGSVMLCQPAITASSEVDWLA
jgi:hypothetical protein